MDTSTRRERPSRKGAGDAPSSSKEKRAHRASAAADDDAAKKHAAATEHTDDTALPPEARVQRAASAPRSGDDDTARSQDLRQLPLARLVGYYAVVIAVAILLSWLFPIVRESLTSTTTNAANVVSKSDALREGVIPLPGQAGTGIVGLFDRAGTTFIVILGALSLVLPVAWVYIYTRRMRHDPALVHSLIILPIAVAGILLVVRNSLALAFSLAGIVAAVRFRNTLKDPRDAVYIFLAIGIGLACGVQAVDVALIMSVIFNLVVLALWKYNAGSLYGAQESLAGVLWAAAAPNLKQAKRQAISAGDPELLEAHSTRDQEQLTRELDAARQAINAHGAILVHTSKPETARAVVEDALRESARAWNLCDVEQDGDDNQTLRYVVRFKKRASPLDVLSVLHERWGSHVPAAEYIPFKKRK
ncbi:MAG TPA: DUF4956 domain-containing protein [Gemmatimonadaceae bacterium]|nr:DUF4956 domain-containing protein [Gemmatimonadaceae bacterium]